MKCVSMSVRWFPSYGNLNSGILCKNKPSVTDTLPWKIAVFYYGNHLKKDRFHNYAKSPKPIKKVSKMEVNKLEPYHTLRKEPTSDKAN